jgi:transcriptional regulator with XRE-family HTH domain
MKKLKLVKITKVLAKNVTTLRESKHWTASELARQVGVSRQAIFNIENELSWITLDKVEKLAQVFGVEQHELFKPHKENDLG